MLVSKVSQVADALKMHGLVLIALKELADCIEELHI
jgi:hypothetical protein